jgi:hypothetical protein
MEHHVAHRLSAQVSTSTMQQQLWTFACAQSERRANEITTRATDGQVVHKKSIDCLNEARGDSSSSLNFLFIQFLSSSDCRKSHDSYLCSTPSSTEVPFLGKTCEKATKKRSRQGMARTANQLSHANRSKRFPRKTTQGCRQTLGLSSNDYTQR